MEGEGVPVLLEQPWARVKEPVAIPAPTTVATLEALSEQDLVVLLRDHLVPRRPDGVERARWEALWRLLSADDALAERCFDVLEQFLSDVDAALADGQPDEHSRKRMEKFRRFCDDAWQRLQMHHDRPLGWAGRAGAGFNPAGRKVIERLVAAIADHRRAVGGGSRPRSADEALWRTLTDVGLDPDGHGAERQP